MFLFQKSRKPRKYDVSSGNRLMNIYPLDKYHTKASKFDVPNRIHFNQESSCRETAKSLAHHPNRDDSHLQPDNCNKTNEIDRDVHDTKVHQNVFRLLKYKRLPVHHQQQHKYTSQDNRFNCNNPHHQVQADNFQPQLDCLRSIKFKLGWHYAQMKRTQGFLRDSVNKEMNQYPMDDSDDVISSRLPPLSPTLSLTSDDSI